MKYQVSMHCVAGLTVEVEADDPESALEAAWDKGLPELMTLDHRYPDLGEGWQPDTEGFTMRPCKIEDVVLEVS